MKNKKRQDERHLQVKYSWQVNGEWNFIEAKTQAQPQAIEEGSEAEFITEHYWGFTKVEGKATSAYQVEHPKWNIHPVEEHQLHCNVKELYGEQFASFMEEPPSSIFMADGSEILVRQRIFI